ncbi:hypothetical protein Q8G41_29110, partial [Klebsiella pneumoniae]
LGLGEAQEIIDRFLRDTQSFGKLPQGEIHELAQLIDPASLRCQLLQYMQQMFELLPRADLALWARRFADIQCVYLGN